MEWAQSLTQDDETDRGVNGSLSCWAQGRTGAGDKPFRLLRKHCVHGSSMGRGGEPALEPVALTCRQARYPRPYGAQDEIRDRVIVPVPGLGLDGF